MNDLSSELIREAKRHRSKSVAAIWLRIAARALRLASEATVGVNYQIRDHKAMLDAATFDLEAEATSLELSATMRPGGDRDYGREPGGMVI